MTATLSARPSSSGRECRSDPTLSDRSSTEFYTRIKSGGLYAYPRGKSIQRFKDRVRQLTRRGAPLTTKDLIEQLNPVLRGWGHYYKRVHVRTLFNKLDRWIERRIWSHRYKRWRNCGWKQLPKRKLYGEYGLVQLVKLIPSIAAQQHAPS